MKDSLEMLMACSITIIIGIGLGYSTGRHAIADDCKTFGAFKHGVVYECKEKK